MTAATQPPVPTTDNKIIEVQPLIKRGEIVDIIHSITDQMEIPDHLRTATTVIRFIRTWKQKPKHQIHKVLTNL